MKESLKRWVAAGPRVKIRKRKGQTKKKKTKGDKNKNDGGEMKKRKRERAGGVWLRSLSRRNWSPPPEVCRQTLVAERRCRASKKKGWVGVQKAVTVEYWGQYRVFNCGNDSRPWNCDFIRELVQFAATIAAPTKRDATPVLVAATLRNATQRHDSAAIACDWLLCSILSN